MLLVSSEKVLISDELNKMYPLKHHSKPKLDLQL